MATTTVINIKDWDRSDPNQVYVGLPGKGIKNAPFGKPKPFNGRCSMCGDLEHTHREYAIACHRRWLFRCIETDPVFRELVKGLYGKTLVCFCYPKNCHAFNLADAAKLLNTPNTQSGI